MGRSRLVAGWKQVLSLAKCQWDLRRHRVRKVMQSLSEVLGDRPTDQEQTKRWNGCLQRISCLVGWECPSATSAGRTARFHGDLLDCSRQTW